MPNANNLATGLATIGQGFGVISKGAEYKKELKLREQELEQKQIAYEIEKEKLKTAEGTVWSKKLSTFAVDYGNRAKENPKFANDYLDLPEISPQIDEMAGKLGFSREKTILSIKNEAEAFRVEQNVIGKTMRGWADKLSRGDPGLADPLRDLSDAVMKAPNKEALKELGEQGYKVINAAGNFGRLQNQGGITQSDRAKNFRPAISANEPGATSVNVQGRGEELLVPVEKPDRKLSTTDLENVDKSIYGRFGLKPYQVKNISSTDPLSGWIYEDTKEIRSKVGSIMAKEDVDASVAENIAWKDYQNQKSYVDDLFQKAIGAGKDKNDSLENEILKSMGTKRLDRTPLEKKKAWLDTNVPQWDKNFKAK